MPTDTAALIAEAERLDKEATKGPWQECGHDREGCQCGLVWALPGDRVIAKAPQCIDGEETQTLDEVKRNARFIARSRTLLPALARALAASEDARREVEALIANLCKAVDAHAALDTDESDRQLTASRVWTAAIKVAALAKARGGETGEAP